jgi:hypothetical protein
VVRFQQYLIGDCHGNVTEGWKIGIEAALESEIDACSEECCGFGPSGPAGRWKKGKIVTGVCGPCHRLRTNLRQGANTTFGREAVGAIQQTGRGGRVRSVGGGVAERPGGNPAASVGSAVCPLPSLRPQ